jgi:hypothetical protein
MKNHSRKRPLAEKPDACRLWRDNHDELMEICQKSGRKPAEELRDIVDEGLRARRASANGQRALQPNEGAPIGNGVGMAQGIQNLSEQHESQNRILAEISRHLREHYGLLLEVLAGAYGARRLIWNHVVEARLRQSGLTPDQIRQQFEMEAKAWNAERDSIADLLEEAIRSLPPAK